MADSAKLHMIQGQASWRLASDSVELYVTQNGGFLAPVTFDRRGQAIRPYAIAPWAEEQLDCDTPVLLKALRGDFFCWPFGGNETEWQGESHPPHGETANCPWTFESADDSELHLSMQTTVRHGRVDKHIQLRPGHNAVYSRHVVSGASGPMPLGHHACLKFPDVEGSGLLSSSPKIHRQVFVEPAENPADGGYSCLKAGAVFEDPVECPTIFGSSADLSRFPLRRGFEDVFIQSDDPDQDFAWNAVSFPDAGYVWLGLKDPKVLNSSLYWWSNGGRHYAPWNGRHCNVLGIEEMTGFFHVGLAESATENCLSNRGIPTAVNHSADSAVTVNYIMAAIPTPPGFGRVTVVSSGPSTVTLHDEAGHTVTAALDTLFLQAARA